jgi:hypothetical protein
LLLEVERVDLLLDLAVVELADIGLGLVFQ